MSDTALNVLTIAGSDPGGGAGIQGDLKTFAALGVYGCAALTALTAQSTQGVAAVMPVPADFVVRQLETLLDDIDVHAVKIGMLGDAAVAAAVAGVIRRYRLGNVVLDPVMHATAGGVQLEYGALEIIRTELLPLVTVVTPNAAEAGALLGAVTPRTVGESVGVARGIVALGARAVLVTGGHVGDHATCVDVLATDQSLHEFSVARVEDGGTHGTGCALSSAIAALLALGHDLPSACGEAQRFVAAAVRSSRRLQVGRGVAPVDVLGARPPATITATTSSAPRPCA